jgi:hypothetical protein
MTQRKWLIFFLCNGTKFVVLYYTGEDKAGYLREKRLYTLLVSFFIAYWLALDKKAYRRKQAQAWLVKNDYPLLNFANGVGLGSWWEENKL